jgi:hypothetical protein
LLVLSLGSSGASAGAFCDHFSASQVCLGGDLPLIEETPPLEFAVGVGGSGSIDFGEVQVGQSSPPRTVTLTNASASPFGPLTIFGGAPPTPEFNAAQSCQGVILQPAGSCTLTYAFSPGAPGAFSDSSNFTISATSSQDDGENFVVALSGTGVTPLAPPCPTPTSCLPDFPNEAALTGSARVKGEGFKSTEAFALHVNFDDATFVLIEGDEVYFGNLVPKGPSGTKFRLFLDDGSRDAWSAEVAARAGAASSRTPGGVLGESSKLVLKLKKSGRVSLDMKINVLDSGLGEVVFRATLNGGPLAR